MTTCWIRSERCAGCDHYRGKSTHCSYRPKTLLGRATYWLSGGCGFKEIFARLRRVQHGN